MPGRTFLSPQASQKIPGATWTGMRRVDYVRITFSGGRPTCEAVGISHRLPASCRIPMRVANALVAAGAPVVTRRRAGVA